ncbi:LysM peptidoglycan-binding domain-containing protein [Trinickia fusca]|uniref:LysM peptidoglycan-binding domain-containing protein n=1 Tax=Trinickia fusca TaxID=2419777 RepID=A0A494XEX1_9BURK|nr:LysM peptidoglycan-binding domain-containing protein [Trinickia fusca]RKP48432.1 LysM peptidoglycan-binding domain-containing protein [Trinickia fusca]
MVAIVSGNGLGLSLSSLSLLGQRGVTGNAAGGRNGELGYVNAANGNLILQDRDDYLAAHGLSVDVLRTYNSEGNYTDGGDSWNVGINRQRLQITGLVYTAGSTITRTDADGTQRVYTYDATRSLYVNSDGADANDTIRYDNKAARLILTNGVTGAQEGYEVGGLGRLLTTTDTVGNTITYSYGSNNLLSKIVDASGETTYLDYTGNDVTQIRTVLQDGTTIARVHYGYDAQNRLSTVSVDLTAASGTTPATSYVTTYGYDGTSKRIASITQSDGSTQSFTYVQVGSDYRIATATDGNGQITRFAYDTTNRRTSVTDPLGLVSTFSYDTAGRLTQLTGPSVNGAAQSTTFTYGTGGHVSQIVDAAGRTVTMQYDANGNQIQQQDSSGNTITRTYSTTFNALLTETVYASPAAGTTQAAQPLTTRYVRDAQNLLRFVVSADGRVIEYRYNANGERTATIQYSGNSYALTGLASTDVPTLDQMQAWAAKANLAQTERTDFAYDFRGQLASRTTYASVDASGNGVADGTQSVTHYVYDPQGRLLSTIDGRSNATQLTYDGLGRVLTSTDAAGHVTVTRYDDAHNLTLVKLASGLTTASIYDKAGHLLSVVQADANGQSLGQTSYTYDADGRLRMTTDPTGVRQFVLYDDAGRKIADIDGAGALTEYRYGAGNDLAQTIAYSTPLTAAALASLVDANGKPVNVSLASIRPAASASDRTTTNVYDASGRLTIVVDAAGDVTRTIYDGASRIVSVIRYATPLDLSKLGANPTIALATPVASAQDRITRNFYDNDGQLIGTLDAEGGLVEYRYDAAGRQTGRIAYATPVSSTAAAQAGATLGSLIPAASSDDAHSYTLYDGKGEVSGQVDAEGYLTETVYDAAGNVAKTIRYATVVTMQAGATVAMLRAASTAEDHVVTNTYTALNQLATSTDVEGSTTQYAYDSAGHLVSTTRAAGTTDQRTLTKQYDVLGRVTAELSAQGASLLTDGMTAAQIAAIWTQYGTSYTYDAAGRRTSALDAAGNKTLFFYDQDGRLTHTVNALGEVEERQYDALGQLVGTVHYGTRIALPGLSGGLESAALANALNAIRNPALDSRTTVTYTATGLVASSKDALGNTSANSYDAFGDVLSTSTPIDATHALTRTFTYDHRGLQTSATSDPLGTAAATSTQYDAFGRAIRTVDANGNVRTQRYDRLGRVVQTFDPTNANVVTTYDAFDRVLTKTDASGTVTYSYSTAGRSLTVKSAEGVTVTTVHTRNGQIASVTDGLGNVTQYTYDKNGNLIQTSTPLTQTTSQYDAANRLIQSTDANGNVVNLTYDAANRLFTRIVDPTGLKLTTTYQYDAKGQQISATDPNGVVTQIRYDAKGQKLSQTVDAGGLNLVTQYSYDARGNTLTVTSPGGTVTQYVYDTLGRRIEQHVDASGLNLVTHTAYDKNGNAVTVTDPNGNVTRNVYDADDRLVYTIDGAGNVTQTTYDAAGHVAQTTTYATPISLANLAQAPAIADVQARVVANAATDVTQLRRYDHDGRLTWTMNGAGGLVNYVYDANGNVTKRTAYANHLSASDLAALEQSGGVPAPIADPAHDLVDQTFYDALNRAVCTVNAAGGVTRTQYDGNGNVIDRVSSAAVVTLTQPLTLAAINAQLGGAGPLDAHVHNAYDKANRLVYTANGVGAVTQNIYDADGNLIRTIAYATPLNPQTLSTVALSSVTSSADDRVTTFAYDAAGRQVFAVDAMGGVARQVFDTNGNVVARTNYANRLANVGLATPTTLAALQAAVIADAVNDRTTRAVFDTANRQVMAIDALGNVTQNWYDAAGNVLVTRAYAHAIDTSKLPAIALPSNVAALLQADAANDRARAFAFDAANRQVYVTDAFGYVKETRYDGTGKITRTTQYATAIASSTASTNALAVAAALKPNAALDRTDSFAYDGAGNLISSTDALGATETYAYNGLGKKIAFTNKKGAVWNYDYDAAGRLLQETGPAIDVATVTAAANGTLSVNAAQSGAARIVTRMGYDGLGNLRSRTEAYGRPEARTTTYSYDPLGHQIGTSVTGLTVYAPGADNLATNGATGLATRTETAAQRSTTVVYDVFGEAVANLDAVGAVSYKVYDKTGHVAYDVDALGYVTSYTRNAFGDTTGLTRYASTVSVGSDVTKPVSAATVTAALNAAGVDHSADRLLTTSYDRLGRAVQVVEPTAYNYDSSAPAGQQYFSAGKTTKTEYNAFGQVVRTSVLKNALTNVWTANVSYYDLGGRQIATVDAMGNLTASSYDAAGNLTAQTEYATAIAAGSWSLTGYTLPTANAADRTTQYGYDRLDRKISETRLNVQYSDTANGNSTTGNLTTTYGYDALGNQTRATDAYGASTYTYYDALGRTVAIATPTRNSTVGGTALTPLSVLRRDAYGNVVAKIDYAQGASSATEAGYTVAGASAADRTSFTQYDSVGNAIQSTDATGVTHYASFDAAGHLVKQWQAVSGNDGVTHTLFEAFQYDKLGRQTDVVDPAPNQPGAGLVDTHVTLNAFGETVAKSLNGAQVEYSDYDTAGRVWRTNTGDGVDKVMLYDLQGHNTATIESSGAWMNNVSLRAFGSADQVAQVAGARRTDVVYDALGHAVQQIGSQRVDTMGGATIFSMSSHATIASSASPVLGEDGHPAVDEGSHVTGWTGTNQLALSWTPLSALGAGDVKVHVEYLTASAAVAYDEQGHPSAWQAGVAGSRDALYTGDAAAQAAGGVTLTWQDPQNTTNGGIGKVTRVTVYKKDINGNWQVVLDQGATPPSDAILVATPNDPATQVQVQVAANGTNGWFALSTINFGDALRADTTGLPPGGYQYRVLTTAPGQATAVALSGSLSVGGITLAPIGTSISYGPAGAGQLAWQTPGAGVDQILRYRVQGTSNWNTLPVTSRANNIDAVDTSGLPGGAYDFELLWTHSGDSTPYAHATGSLSVSNPIPPRYVPPVNLPNITGVTVGTGQVGGTVTGYDESGEPIYATTESGAIIGATQSNVIQWPQAGAPTKVVFQYRAAGASAWTPLTVYTYPSGNTESGAQVGTQRVDIGKIAPGNYQYQILLMGPNGAPTAQATGNLTVNGQGPGHYETHNVQVQVPVTVNPPAPSNYITGWTRATYSAPIATYDESGNAILAPHYQWQGNVVVAVPYTVTQITGYTTQTYPVQVPVRGDPIILRDENGQPIRDESGNIQYARDESGNIEYTTKYVTQYQTRQVPVYGNVTVTPPDPSRYMTAPSKPIYGAPVVVGTDESGHPILGQHYQWQGNVIVGVPYTVMQTQTQQQQVWVPGTTPPPSIASTTPPYTPGYTIPGTPKGFGVGISTGSNPQAISIAGRDGLAAAGSASYATNARPVVNRTVDRWGNVLSISDPRSGAWVTTYRYNANNQLIEQDQPNSDGVQGAGPVQRIAYDRLGRQVAVVDANGHVNGKLYDAAGNVTAEVHADGGVLRHAYNAFGNEVRLIDALGNSTTYAYDNLDRLISTTHGVVGVYTVDGNNNLQLQATRNLVESTGYDQAGRKLWTSNGNGEVVRYDYDLRGNIVATTQPLGQVTRDAYDVEGHKISEVDANGSTATWRYDHFGQLQAHTDIGGANYSYTYDGARQLIAQSNSRGQNQTMQYDAAGQLTAIVDNAVGQVTTYAYNAAGQHVRERTVQGGIVYQDSHLAYDALGRLRDVADTRVHLSIDYDNVGNRLHEHTHVLNNQDAARDSDLWYAYDAMNRQTVVDGTSPQGGIVQGQGHLIGYDLNGNRTSDTSIGARITSGGGNSYVAGYTIDGSNQTLLDESGRPILNVSTDAHGRTYYGLDESGNPIYVTAIHSTTPITYSASTGATTEQYTYDAVGRISQIFRDGTPVDTRYYDGAGRMVQSGPAGSLSLSYTNLLGSASTPGVQTTINRFDANGRMLHQRVLKANGAADHETNYDSYDNVGNLLQYRFFNQDGSAYTNTYQTTLVKYEGYKEGTVHGTSTVLQPGTTTDGYDVNGNLVAVTDATQAANNRTLVNDAQGHVLFRNQGGNKQFFVFANGQQVGTTGMGINVQSPSSNGHPNFAEVESFNVGYQSIDANYPQASVGSYRVNAGDTLQSIAQSAYGDNQLWYLIADANNLHGDSDLKVGQTITIPTTPGGIHNNGTNFKPYDPGKAVGDTTPNLAAPPAHGGGGGCGVFGMIVAAVVAVVATVFTAGVAAVGIGAGFSSIMAAGASAMVGGLGVAGMGYAALGAAVGSIASQGVSMAMGMQSGFNWGAVGISALTAGITAGVGGEVAPALGKIAPGLGITGDGVQALAERAVLGSVMSQGIEVATGLQHSFNWVGVAAAAAGAAVGGEVADGLKGSAFVNALGSAGSTVSQTLQGIASGTTVSLVQGGRVNLEQVAADSFGNALGQDLVDHMKTVGQQEEILANNASEVQQSTAPANPVPSGPASFSTLFGVYGGLLQQPDYRTFGGSGGGLFDTAASTDSQPSPQTVRAGDYGGSLERIARAQLGADADQHAINNYVGQLAEINGIANPRRIGADQQLQLPDSSTPAATTGLGVYSKDIAYGEHLKAVAQAEQAKAAAQATANDAYREANRFAGFLADNQATAAQAPAPAASLSAGTSGSAGGTVDRLIQSFGGTALGVVHLVADTARFVNDQGWVAANALTGGWLADHNDDAMAAVQRNSALGHAMVEAPGKVATFGLRLATGDVSLDEVKQDVRTAWQSDRIDRLEAAGDYAGAQAIRTQNVLGIFSLAVGGEGVIADLAEAGGTVARTTSMGVKLAAEDIATSRTMQLAGAKFEEFNYQLGIGPSYIMPPDFRVTAPLDVGGAGDAGLVGDNAAHSAYQYELLKRDLLRQEIANPGEAMSGPVVLRDPVAGATPGQVEQIRQYAAISNLAIDEGYMSPTGRVSTAGEMRDDASAAAREERKAAEAEGRPYTGVVGHGPDTTWTGRPVSPFWLDMDSSINSSLGRQAQNYPIGYKPTRFIYEGDLNWTGNGNW